MVQTKCGFNDGPVVKGCDLLVQLGPTLYVDIGFDPNFKLGQCAPVASLTQMRALVDTGATECCIDSLVASTLKLPIIDRRVVAGISGTHVTNMYLAQVHVPLLRFTI